MRSRPKSQKSDATAAILKKTKKDRSKSGDRLDFVREYAKASAQLRGEEKAIRDEKISQPTADFESGEDLAAAITKKCDLVEVGLELLKEGGKTKNPTIRLRMWEAIMERMFGKASAAAHEDEQAPQIVLDGLPRPERNPIKGEKS